MPTISIAAFASSFVRVDLRAFFRAGLMGQVAADVGSQGRRECHEIPSVASEPPALAFV